MARLELAPGETTAARVLNARSSVERYARLAESYMERFEAAQAEQDPEAEEIGRLALEAVEAHREAQILARIEEAKTLREDVQLRGVRAEEQVSGVVLLSSMILHGWTREEALEYAGIGAPEPEPTDEEMSEEEVCARIHVAWKRINDAEKRGEDWTPVAWEEWAD